MLLKQSSRGYSFYYTYLIPAPNNKATICWFDWGSNKSHFETTEIANQEENNNRKMFLAVTPNKRQVSVYIFANATETAPQHQQIMSRLCDVIQ
ncbi:MAG: hypothetical protein WCF23_12285 [Candidatus Nitrosopolaris sp.]